MAMFHFRIKFDEKPDGIKISLVMHVDYINREGAFSDMRRQSVNANFVHNLISSAEIKDACGRIDTLLYRTDVLQTVSKFQTMPSLLPFLSLFCLLIKS